MINLSKEIANLSSGLSKSIKDESNKLVKSIAESNVMTSAKINQELDKMVKENKKIKIQNYSKNCPTVLLL